MNSNKFPSLELARGKTRAGAGEFFNMTVRSLNVSGLLSDPHFQNFHEGFQWKHSQRVTPNEIVLERNSGSWKLVELNISLPGSVSINF